MNLISKCLKMLCLDVGLFSQNQCKKVIREIFVKEIELKQNFWFTSLKADICHSLSCKGLLSLFDFDPP